MGERVEAKSASSSSETFLAELPARQSLSLVPRLLFQALPQSPKSIRVALDDRGRFSSCRKGNPFKDQHKSTYRQIFLTRIAGHHRRHQQQVSRSRFTCDSLSQVSANFTVESSHPRSPSGRHPATTRCPLFPPLRRHSLHLSNHQVSPAHKQSFLSTNLQPILTMLATATSRNF